MSLYERQIERDLISRKASDKPSSIRRMICKGEPNDKLRDEEKKAEKAPHSKHLDVMIIIAIVGIIRLFVIYFW